MTQQPAHDRLDHRPNWGVQVVLDPDGTGRDFAYTVGLHDSDRPELHVWGRPSLGEDPGADWMLSGQDQGWVLNELATRLLGGGIDVGSEVVLDFDGGETTARFRLDPPGDREELEAFGIADGAQVLPVRWSLHRPPEGRPAGLGGATLRHARHERRAVLATVDPALPAPPGWSLAGRPGWGHGQRWGPLTPVVLARAAQLWQADVDHWNTLLRATADAVSAGHVRGIASQAFATARRLGRRAAMERLHDDVHELVDHLADSVEHRDQWEELGRSLWGRSVMDDPEQGATAESCDRGLLHDVTLAVLTTEAVADAVPRGLLLAARGPWLAGLGTEEGANEVWPGPEWSAPEAVVDLVVGRLVELDEEDLADLAAAHTSALGIDSCPAGRREDPHVEGYGDLAYAALVDRLRGAAITAPACCPPEALTRVALPRDRWRFLGAEGAAATEDDVPVAVRFDEVDDPWGDLDRGRTLIDIGEVLEGWATTMTSAICHRAVLTADEVDLLVSPVRHLLPGLARTLNEPVVAPVVSRS